MTRQPCRFVKTIGRAGFSVLVRYPSPVVRNRRFAGRRARAAQGTRGIDRAGSPPGEPLSPGRLERWRAMPPEERERIRERYRRWKELPPEERERIRSGTVDGGNSPRSSGTT